MTALPLATAAVLGLTGLSPATAAPDTAANNGEVSVFHGIPGVNVDVYANGRKILSDFTPGTLTRSMDLRQGGYDIKVLRAGAAASSTPLVEKKDVKVADGSNSTLVANLNTKGQPALNTFSNDVSPVPSGQARLTVRHVAAAPAVDIRANGRTVFKDLKNPDEAKSQVPAGTVNADVVLTGTDTVVLGPAELSLRSGSNTVVYAWGSASDENLALRVQALNASAAPN